MYWLRQATHAYDYQDSHQEVIIHNGKWDKANDFRHVLEGAGDIFREFSKYESGWFDPGYINEKIRRVQSYLVGGGQRFNEAYQIENVHDSIDTLRFEWAEQPILTPIQQIAKELNIALVQNKIDAAAARLAEIKTYTNANPNKEEIE